MSDQSVMELVLGETPYPVNVPFSMGSHVVVFGFAIEETTTTAPARVVLNSGSPSPSFVAIPITLNAGESVRDWFGPQGVHFRNGISITVTSGAVQGSVFVSDPPAPLRR